jgi:formylglycine-generating enzyme required for sulfatase activity
MNKIFIIKGENGYYNMMKKIIFFPLLFSLFIFMSGLFHAAAVTKGIYVTTSGGQNLYLYKDYYALVVGVGDYDKWPDLSDSVKNSKEFSWFLRQRGFNVKLLIDPDSQELKGALNDIAEDIGQEPDRGIVFYYSGHGETQILSDGTKLGWIIPRDCPLLKDDPQRFAKLAISMKTIEEYSKRLRSRHLIMFFDSSFSGSVFTTETAALRFVLEKNALPMRQYIIASREDEPVTDQTIFIQSMLKGLKGNADYNNDGYITGSELGVYLADRLVKDTKGPQHIQYCKIKDSTSNQGDFVFLLKETKLDTGRLFVETHPKDALVKILNIRPRFVQGMELKSGRYNLEVSAKGYAVKKEWIPLTAGEDKTIQIHLNQLGDVLVNGLGMKFVLIHPGSFTMGSSQSEPGRLNDEDAHRVTLTKGFYMQTTEVTVGQFRQFIQATGYKTEAEKKGGCWIRSEKGKWEQKKGSNWDSPGSWETIESRQTDNHPVTCISWNDTQAFIRWLTRKEGMTYGLPTEAGWEYACRTLKTTPFSYGSCLSTSQANFGSVGAFFSNCKDAYGINRKMPIIVGKLVPNPWGLFDMHGNVSEWCYDWYGPYPNRSPKNPKGPSKGAERVMRGGHWISDAHDCRCAGRGSFLTDSASDAIGFRLVVKPSS